MKQNFILTTLLGLRVINEINKQIVVSRGGKHFTVWLKYDKLITSAGKVAGREESKEFMNAGTL